MGGRIAYADVCVGEGGTRVCGGIFCGDEGMGVAKKTGVGEVELGRERGK